MESIFFGVNLNLGGAKLMVVDDCETSRKAVVSILERQGFKMLEAKSGEEAIEMAVAEDPDLILMDIVLTGMDGFEACQRFKETPKINEIPIIFLTSKAEMRSILQGFSAGGSDYIVKPFNPIEALARISAHVQVRLLLKSQKKLIDALSKANDSKTRMIGVASHDLRGPLGSIAELTRLIVDGTIGTFDDDQKDIIKSINQGTDSMLGLVENLLDVSMIESGNIKLNVEELAIEEILQKAVDLQQISAKKKDITIQFTNQGIFDTVQCDRRQIRRLVDNLLSNAIKYSPNNTTAELTVGRVGDYVIIRMEDEGPGIPETEMHNVFKEFGTTSVKPTGGEISTGLGMSICKKIVEAHQGHIRIENKTGNGLRCQVEIPVKQFKAAPAESPAVSLNKKETAPTSPRRINQAFYPDNSHKNQPRQHKKTAYQDATYQ